MKWKKRAMPQRVPLFGCMWGLPEYGNTSYRPCLFNNLFFVDVDEQHLHFFGLSIEAILFRRLSLNCSSDKLGYFYATAATDHISIAITSCSGYIATSLKHYPLLVFLWPWEKKERNNNRISTDITIHKSEKESKKKWDIYSHKQADPILR